MTQHNNLPIPPPHFPRPPFFQFSLTKLRAKAVAIETTEGSGIGPRSCIQCVLGRKVISELLFSIPQQ